MLLGLLILFFFGGEWVVGIAFMPILNPQIFVYFLELNDPVGEGEFN